MRNFKHASVLAMTFTWLIVPPGNMGSEHKTPASHPDYPAWKALVIVERTVKTVSMRYTTVSCFGDLQTPHFRSAPLSLVLLQAMTPSYLSLSTFKATRAGA